MFVSHGDRGVSFKSTQPAHLTPLVLVCGCLSRCNLQDCLGLCLHEGVHRNVCTSFIGVRGWNAGSSPFEVL
jgi:hypothetical protein